MDERYRDYSGSKSGSKRASSAKSSSSRTSSSVSSRELQYTSTRPARNSSSSYRSSSDEYRPTYKKPVSEATKRARARRAKQRRRRILFGFIFLIVLLAAAIIVVISALNNGGDPSDPGTSSVLSKPVDPDHSVFPEGVTVNGFQLSGKTATEAKDIVTPGIDQTVERIAVTLTGNMGDESFRKVITGPEMNISTDLDDILLVALSGKRNGTYHTTFIVDYDAVKAKIQEINSELSFGPADASFEFTTNSKGKTSINYIEGRTGTGIDVDKTLTMIREQMEAGNYQFELTPELTLQEPNVTVDDIKQNVSLIGSYTTQYRNKGLSSWTEERRQTTLNRSFNVEKAAGIVNGQIVQPGATWSYNKVVGDRNAKNGWKEANAVHNGNTYRLEYGGGVCQVSTTLYNALLRANIQIVSRSKHSIPADYVAYGLDATVDYGHIDFKFKNNTDCPLYIFTQTKVKSGETRWSELTVSIYGKALPEGVTYEPRAVTTKEIEPGETIIKYNKKQLTTYQEVTTTGRKGYVVEVYLDKKQNGKTVESTYLYTDEYDAVTEVITVGTIEPTTPTPVVPVVPDETPAQ